MDRSDTPRPGSPGSPLWDPGAIPAATVIVLRDSEDGVESLMLRRDKDLSFAGGTWVFPGGRIDPGDHLEPAPSAGTPDLESASRRAAVREAAEEAGLLLEPSQLQRWSHWTPPPESPRRFTTAFYVTAVPADAGEIVIDDGEIREHRWRRPSEMLELREAGHVSLTPPTFITLWQLLDAGSVSDALRREPDPVEHFATRIAVEGDEIIAMYHGDAGYESGDAGAPGPRHRLVMSRTWHYERDT